MEGLQRLGRCWPNSISCSRSRTNAAAVVQHAVTRVEGTREYYLLPRRSPRPHRINWTPYGWCWYGPNRQIHILIYMPYTHGPPSVVGPRPLHNLPLLLRRACKRMFQVFHLDVAYILQWLHTCFSGVSDVCCKCFSCFRIYITSASSGCCKSKSSVAHVVMGPTCHRACA
jgi:hypothetical protein